jgi:hypothetical protein
VTFGAQIAQLCAHRGDVVAAHSAAPNGGYLEWFGNLAWSGGIFAALTCCRGSFGRVAVVVVGWLAGGVLGALEAKLAGDLLAEGAVFGSEPGDLGPGGVEPLAKRAGAGALCGRCGRGWVLVA